MLIEIKDQNLSFFIKITSTHDLFWAVCAGFTTPLDVPCASSCDECEAVHHSFRVSVQLADGEEREGERERDALGSKTQRFTE